LAARAVLAEVAKRASAVDDEEVKGEPVPARKPGDAVTCPTAERPWPSWALDVLGVALFALLFASCGAALTRALSEVAVPPGVAILGAALVASWLAADAMSGLVHYFADNHGSPDWPVLGDALIRPFREHHEHPERLLEHGVLERSGGPALLGCSVLGLALLVPGPALAQVGMLGFSLGLGGFTALTNEVHALAHRPIVPRWVRFLQRRGILLSPELHSLHHEGSHDTHYCITSGVVDRVLATRRRGSEHGHLARRR